MDTWIVGRDHLDLLLTAAIDWNVITADQADETGRMLWKENLASVAHRYPNDRNGYRPGAHGFRDRDVDTYAYLPYPGRVDPKIVQTAAASLRRQSYWHPVWHGSAAEHWVNHLHQLATDRIPAYLAEHGPIDPYRQAWGEDGWYVLTDRSGHRQIRSADGWNVPNRDVLHRAAVLRTAATP
ncbi:hypothetical protein [Actinoplanes flavus]|uniref:Uncharacterized protein n=1 Tax=Actinoplanes flavus TaxID=2820290 RepID=A0ABS3UEJ2_9ACTN|nr:hypothetical protein [Actinoplanes flavus]MBO3736651.1 hypothetical protein [Actinoplanes flavus]